MESNNRVVLITGANGGLGTVVTRAFLDAGSSVFGVSRSISDAEFSHPAFHALPAEIKTAAQAAAVVGRVHQEGGRIAR